MIMKYNKFNMYIGIQKINKYTIYLSIVYIIKNYFFSLKNGIKLINPFHFIFIYDYYNE